MHVERADKIDGDELLPLRWLGLDEGAEHVPAGVVDQDVDRAEFRLCRADRRIDVGPLGDVAGERRGDPAGLLDPSRDLARCIEIEVEYGDFGAFAGEPAAGRPADAAAAAGDHDDLSRKTRQSFFLPHNSELRPRSVSAGSDASYVNILTYISVKWHTAQVTK